MTQHSDLIDRLKTAREDLAFARQRWETLLRAPAAFLHSLVTRGMPTALAKARLKAARDAAQTLHLAAMLALTEVCDEIRRSQGVRD